MNEFDATNLSAGELLEALTEDKIQLPCWIRVGRAAHRVDPEDKDGVKIGLQLALDIKFKE